MADSALIEEFQEFSRKTVEIQQQYISLVNQILPAKEYENRSLARVKNEIEALPIETTVYHSVGKIFLISDMKSTYTMIDASMESNKRSLSILLEKKNLLEKSLKEAENSRKIYLSKLNSTN